MIINVPGQVLGGGIGGPDGLVHLHAETSGRIGQAFPPPAAQPRGFALGSVILWPAVGRAANSVAAPARKNYAEEL
jgi:hypothetical protein